MSLINNYLQTAVQAKREGRYKDSYHLYLEAMRLVDKPPTAIEVYEFNKAYGKLNFILGDYHTACTVYKSSLKGLAGIAEDRAYPIKTAQDIYDVDPNIVLHLGYAVLADCGQLDIIEHDSYRRSIDPYYDRTTKKSSYQPRKDIETLAIKVGIEYVSRNLLDILSSLSQRATK